MRVKNGQVINIDILPILQTCLEGLCDFMEEVYLSFKVGGDYDPGDTLHLTGNDENVTAFWPSLKRKRPRAS